MESKHTPGPWTACQFRGTPHPVRLGERWPEVQIRVGSNETTGGMGNVLALVVLGGVGAISFDRADIEANARLIAAAPDLLEALRDVVDLFEWEESDSAQERAYDAAVAAIGKATSQTT